MNRSRIFLAAGVALALVVFVAVLAFGNTIGGSQPVKPAAVSVVVAAQDVALGTPLTAEMLSTEDRPADQAVGTYGSVGELVGAVARRAITHGQVVHTSDFQTEGTGAASVTQSLKGGLRAIALPLDEASAVAYLIQPGDWVDVMISLEDKDNTNPVVEPNPRYNQPVGAVGGTTTDTTPYIVMDEYTNNTSVKVLVQNVQVLAVQQKQSAPQTNAITPNAASGPQFLAIVAVNPQQAELLRFAQLDGNVSLILRSAADQGAPDVATGGVTLHELVEKYGVLPPVPVTP